MIAAVIGDTPLRAELMLLSRRASVFALACESWHPRVAQRVAQTALVKPLQDLMLRAPGPVARLIEEAIWEFSAMLSLGDTMSFEDAADVDCAIDGAICADTLIGRAQLRLTEIVQ